MRPYNPCPSSHIPLLATNNATVRELQTMYPRSIPWGACATYLQAHDLLESWTIGGHPIGRHVATDGFLWWCGFLWTMPGAKAVSQKWMLAHWQDIPY